MNRDKIWFKLMDFGARLGCHQMPERSFFYKGYQFPVCARCTGAIISLIFALPLFFIKKTPVWLCTLFSSVMLTDWSLQFFKIKESTNKRRFITGLVGGFGYFTLYLYFLSFIFKKIRQIFF